ncbi:MAG: prepilin peptidase [bacterium]
MNTLYAVLFFMFGTLVASFAHLVGLRLPKKETLLGKSHCPACAHDLRLLDVFPVVGFLVNRGKCHFCHAKIPIFHLFVEIAGGALFSVSYLIFGFSWELAAALMLTSVLIIEVISDIAYQVVIDRVWIAGTALVVILRIVDGTFFIHLLATVILTGFLWLVAVIGKAAFKKEALGGGDVKLFLFFGWCLTWSEGLLAIFVASLLGFVWGTVFRKSVRKEIALVPFLAAGVLIAYFWGSDVIAWYLQLLGV